MDVFFVSENDKFNIVKKAEELGIVSYDTHGIKASGQTWYEEEGVYMKNAKLVVVLADRDMMNCSCCGYCINVAKRNEIPVFVFFQDDGVSEEEFRSHWEPDETFSEGIELLSRILEFQMDNRTVSGLSIRANTYFNAAMYDESLKVCNEFVNKLIYDLSQNEGYNYVLLVQAADAVFEKMAMIYIIKGEYENAENALKNELRLTETVRVIWGGDQVLYIKNLLKRLYSGYMNKEDAERIEEEIKGKYVFGGDEAKSKKNTEIMLQKAEIFFEKCRNLKKQYQKEKSENVDKEMIMSEQEDVYHLIGEHIKSSILLFNKLAENGADCGFGECLRTGYKRLAEYCKIIGANDMALKCLDMITLNLNKLKVNDEEDENSKHNLKCIKAYLGETLPDSGYFDVFISHKSEDTDIAAEIYAFLKEKGKVAFLDRISLPYIGDSEYRNAILDSLDKSSHFVLVASDLEYLRSKWVSQEYNLFCDEKREGRKSGNLIMVFPEELCKKIYASNKKDLPIQLRSFEIIGLERFKENLADYII